MTAQRGLGGQKEFSETSRRNSFAGTRISFFISYEVHSVVHKRLDFSMQHSGNRERERENKSFRPLLRLCQKLLFLLRV